MSVTTTYYSIDNGSTWHRYAPTNQPAFRQDGLYTVQYFSVDKAGNRESIKSISLKIDQTKPTITFTGNRDSYTVDEQITVTCTADDPLVNGTHSGLASATCPDINATAWSLGLGAHTLTATATDNAGNRTDRSITFTIQVTFDSLCTLTQRWVTNQGLAHALCQKLDHAKDDAAKGNRAGKDGQMKAYVSQVGAAVHARALAQEQANILISLAKNL